MSLCNCSYFAIFLPLDNRKYFKGVRASVVTLQKHLKRYIHRKRFVKQRKAALVLQKHRRGQVARTRVRKLREAKKKKEDEQKKKEEGNKIQEEGKVEEEAMGNGEKEELNEGDDKKVMFPAAHLNNTILLLLD